MGASPLRPEEGDDGEFFRGREEKERERVEKKEREKQKETYEFVERVVRDPQLLQASGDDLDPGEGPQEIPSERQDLQLGEAVEARDAVDRVGREGKVPEEKR